ncbi:MAG: arylesterase [Betaproteobacteria bacterium]|jgi:acyl-CoA thioesterase-1|nr:arylesterase [Betaproteobacteria bacterium]
MLRKLILVVLAAAWCPAAAAATILVFGDSLSAAYGIGAREGWPTLLEERLRQNKLDYTVANASISGETSSGGATRIADAVKRTRPSIVIVALGSNDGLRGLPVDQMKANLNRIVRTAKSAGSKVLVVGSRMPPNYGPRYTREFEQVFAEVATEQNAALVPFMLAGIATTRDYFLSDNLHPTAAAQPIILDTIWRGLKPLLEDGAASR